MACVGNHEFDDGADNLAELAKIASFPFLGANIVERATGKTPVWVKPYVLREFGGVKVAFIGVVTTDTDVISGGSGSMKFLEEGETLRKTASLVKKKGASIVIALTHVGFDRDKELAANLPGISLIIGGHSHTFLKKGWEHPTKGVRVTQAGSYATHIGRIDIVVSKISGAILSLKTSLPFLAYDYAPEDPGVKALLEEKSRSIREVMDEPLGEIDAQVDRGGRKYSGVSSPLGNLLADLMREAGEADLAFHNRTGIRDILRKGMVTRRDVFKVCPFGNTVFTMDLTGREVLEVLEYALSQGNRFLLEVSGGKVDYDPGRPVGKRVLSLEVAGKPVDPASTYRVATSNFIASGGDAHGVFPRGRNRKDTGILTRDRLEEKIRSSIPLRVEYVNRMIKR
jgi:2',3'-cyclic-nucleotide 2'-phosphodiesterase (5'-nucleotidase family)